MDTRGGTITWQLDVDDYRFDVTMRKVRLESRRAASVVDKNLNKPLKNVSNNLKDFRQDLHTSAMVFRDFQIALRGFNLTSLIVGVATAGGALIQLAGALTAAVQAGYAIPGMVASVIGAFATVKIATLNVSDAFKALGKDDPEKLAEALAKLSPAAKEFVLSMGAISESFKPMRLAVQENFFRDLGKQMEPLAAKSLPMLRVGLENAATAMNGLFKETIRVAGEPFFQGAIANTLATTAQSTTILTKAVEPLAIAVAGLVEVGLPYTNMLAEWIVKQSQVAATFISSEAGQKKLTDAINFGISALGVLFDLVGSVFDLFTALFNVSNKEGLSLVQTITDIVDRMTAWVNSAEGQKLLTALFKLTNDALVAVAEVAGDVLVAILKIIEGFNSLNPAVRDIALNFLAWSVVLTPILTYISALFASGKLVFVAFREVYQTGRVALFFLKREIPLVTTRLGLMGLQLKKVGVGIAGTAKSIGGSIAGIGRSTAGVGKSAVSASTAWIANMGRITGAAIRTAAVASVQAGRTALAWITAAVRSAAAWVASTASMVARQVWAGFAANSPAGVAALAWIGNAARVAAAWAVNMAKVVAGWVISAATAVSSAAASGAAWIASAAGVAGAWVANMVRVVASFVTTAAAAVFHNLAIKAAFVSSASGSALAWATNVAKIVLGWVTLGAKAIISGLAMSTAFVSAAARVGLAWLALNLRMLPFFVGWALGSVVNAVIASSAWVAAAVVTAAAWIVANAVILGVIGLIIAAVIGMVILIVKNWDTIVEAAKMAWEFIKNAVAGAINWIKQNWPLVLAIITGPIGVAVYLITKYWDEIKTGISNLINSVRDSFGKVVDFIVSPFKTAFNSVSSLWNRSIGSLSFKAPDWVPGIGGKGWTLPKMPMLAEGGIAMGPTVAMIGEGSEPEAVIPLSKIGQVASEAGGGTTIENNIGTINIGSEVDGENWLKRLTRDDQITKAGLVGA